MIVKSGIVEIKSSDPYMRSFLIPNARKGNCRVNVYSNKRNGLYTAVIQNGVSSRTIRKLTADGVIDVLKKKVKPFQIIE